MKKLLMVALVFSLTVLVETGCATKKYVRNRVAERVTPLENRAGELEETSRRNTQQIGELRTGIDEVNTRVGRAQEVADRAASSAEQANTRVSNVERSVEELRSNLDKYTLTNTASVFFPRGSARLTPEAMAQLDTLASQITDRNGFVLEIVGYGDSVRQTRASQTLAQMRAEAVQRYLADRHNITLMRMFALGMGGARPVTVAEANAYNNGGAMTSSSNGTAVNNGVRRVEIRLLTNNAVSEAPMRSTSTGTSGGTN